MHFLVNGIRWSSCVLERGSGTWYVEVTMWKLCLWRRCALDDTALEAGWILEPGRWSVESGVDGGNVFFVRFFSGHTCFIYHSTARPHKPPTTHNAFYISTASGSTGTRTTPKRSARGTPSPVLHSHSPLCVYLTRRAL